MKIITFSLTILLLFSFSLKADVVTGTFQTEKSEEGNYLHVKFGPCPKDKNLTCGKIKGSFLSNGSKNKNSKIYVAGHNGLVGSAIVRKLKKNGYKKIILRKCIK